MSWITCGWSSEPHLLTDECEDPITEVEHRRWGAYRDCITGSLMITPWWLNLAWVVVLAAVFVAAAVVVR